MYINSKGQDSGKKIEYSTYEFTGREWVQYILEGCAVIFLFGYFFYRSIWGILLLLPLLYPYLKRKKKSLGEKRRYEFNLQFKEMLHSVNSSIQAGYSLENAFFEAYRDMAVLYGGESYIVTELALIKRGIRNNRTLEEMIIDLGKRSGVEDIRNFADILVIGKRSGGNLHKMIQVSVNVIEEKTAVLQEIQTMISAKRFEQKIMNVIPFFIIFYVELTSKGFFDVLYHNAAGIIIMSICMGLYLVSIVLSERVIRIVI